MPPLNVGEWLNAKEKRLSTEAKTQAHLQKVRQQHLRGAGVHREHDVAHANAPDLLPVCGAPCMTHCQLVEVKRFECMQLLVGSGTAWSVSTAVHACSD
jgi:hypothetical protein